MVTTAEETLTAAGAEVTPGPRAGEHDGAASDASRDPVSAGGPAGEGTNAADPRAADDHTAAPPAADPSAPRLPVFAGTASGTGAAGTHATAAGTGAAGTNGATANAPAAHSGLSVGGDASGVPGPAVGAQATAKELAERGLAQALAAALWEAEPSSEALPPLPSHVPSLMLDDSRTYTAPSAEALAMASFDIPTEVSVRAKAKRAAKQQSEEPPVWFTESMDELLRLQQRQQDHVEKLYAENRVLRGGELAHALAPLLTGLTKLYDQMARLAEADGPASSAALLQRQLLQMLEHAANVEIYSPEPGVTFDATRQRGVAAVDTDDRLLDGRVSSTLRPGFLSSDGTVIRVAEVEVLRFRADAAKTPGPSATATTRGSAL